MKYFIPFLSGIIGAIGLGISGMMSPDKVKSFLDITRNFDPSLMFVMAGGIAVYAIGFFFIKKREQTVLGDVFSLPTKKELDIRLIGGAVLFGIGWAIAGICPGPAIANLATLDLRVIVFIVFMIIGGVLGAYI